MKGEINEQKRKSTLKSKRSMSVGARIPWQASQDFSRDGANDRITMMNPQWESGEGVAQR